MNRYDEPSGAPSSVPVLFHCVLGTASIAVLAVTMMIGIAATDWIHKPFPGFFVLANRVIPSVGLPSWSGSRDGSLYQRTVVTIEGQPIAEAADVYRYVEQWPVGSPLTYELRTAAGAETRTIASQLISRTDYWLIFGAYLGTGLLYLLLGLLGAWYFPGLHFGRALFAVGTLGGIYALSAVGIYGPSFDLRLHALAEAFLPAALAYLALVFPDERQDITKPSLIGACALSLALALPYQLLLMQPGAYFWRPPHIEHGPYGSLTGWMGFFRSKGGVMINIWSDHKVPFSFSPPRKPVLPPEYEDLSSEEISGTTCY